MREPIDLMKDAWSRFREHIALYVGIYLVPAVLTVVFALMTESYSMTSMSGAGMGLIGLLLAITIMVINILAGIAMIKAVDNPSGMSIGNAYKASLSHFWQYLWVSILTGVTVVVGFILFIIPGILFMVWFAFALLILILEGKKGIAAMKASREYVRGKWWAVFGRMVLLIVALLVVSIAANLIAGILTMGATGVSEALASIVNIVVVPFSIVYFYLLYKDVQKGGAPAAAEEATSQQSDIHNAEAGL